MAFNTFLSQFKQANSGGSDLETFAYGTGTLVTGTIVIATGLRTVTAFTTALVGTGASASGATDVASIVVSSITTGAVSCVGTYHAATGVRIASASGTATFYWMAIGTT